jgi:N-acetylglutamate synthase-like GNAT family acetyltransferase
MRFETTSDKELLQQADQLMYDVLWEPFGLPRDIRSKFKVEGQEKVIVALDEDKVVGAMVLIIQEAVAEIRHAAVYAKYQHSGLGRALFNHVLTLAMEYEVNKLEVYARNSAIDYWEKMGFSDISGWLDHDFFVNHGIRFKRMVRDA